MLQKSIIEGGQNLHQYPWVCTEYRIYSSSEKVIRNNRKRTDNK